MYMNVCECICMYIGVSIVFMFLAKVVWGGVGVGVEIFPSIVAKLRERSLVSER